MPDAPPSGGVNPIKVGLGVGLLVLLNIAFNELMDDSGLHVLMMTARLPEGTNATARAAFRAQAELIGMTMEDASGTSFAGVGGLGDQIRELREVRSSTPSPVIDG